MTTNHQELGMESMSFGEMTLDTNLEVVFPAFSTFLLNLSGIH